ncbi:hypothetical protein HGB24_01580 [Candidatus Saccharibacteria bacterium]|nr:hypothetical protein [Candidatus Saccharibacteria bacterium]
MKQSNIYKIVSISSLVGLTASFFQLLDKLAILKNPSTPLICNINSVFSCSNILNAWQSSVFGFPNSIMCIIFFALIISAGLIGVNNGIINRQMRLFYMWLSFFFVGFGFWYLSQSIFEVGAMCIYCVFCYSAVLTISGSLFRLNYTEISKNKTVKKFLTNMVKNQIDILIWIIIALVIIGELIIKFV